MPSKKSKNGNRKGPSSSSEVGAAALLEDPETKPTPSTSSSSAAAAAALMASPPIMQRATASSSTSPPRVVNEEGDKQKEEALIAKYRGDADEPVEEEEDLVEALLAEEIVLDEPTPVSVLEKDATLAMPTMSVEDWASKMEAMRKVADSEADDAKVNGLHEVLQQRIEDVRLLEEHQTLAGRCLEDIGKDRDRIRMEIKRNKAAQAKLQASCKELQGMRGTITQETKKIVAEEEGRQADLNEKFQQAMKDVEEKMEAEKQVREHFVKENEELRSKLQKFMETYEAQEKHLAEQVAVRAKEMEIAQERLKEYETKSIESKKNAANLEKENKVLQKTTGQLRTELQNILGKFDDFQESVTGSNQRHGECKSEIDGLQSRFQELESENVKLRENTELNELTKQQQAAQKQKQALDKLCENLAKEIEGLRGRLTGKSSGRGGG